ncbi:hypothetical protein AAY473_010035 [Plecturocebus cupreus]
MCVCLKYKKKRSVPILCRETLARLHRAKSPPSQRRGLRRHQEEGAGGMWWVWTHATNACQRLHGPPTHPQNPPRSLAAVARGGSRWQRCRVGPAGAGASRHRQHSTVVADSPLPYASKAGPLKPTSPLAVWRLTWPGLEQRRSCARTSGRTGDSAARAAPRGDKASQPRSRQWPLRQEAAPGSGGAAAAAPPLPEAPASVIRDHPEVPPACPAWPGVVASGTAASRTKATACGAQRPPELPSPHQGPKMCCGAHPATKPGVSLLLSQTATFLLYARITLQAFLQALPALGHFPPPVDLFWYRLLGSSELLLLLLSRVGGSEMHHPGDPFPPPAAVPAWTGTCPAC